MRLLPVTVLGLVSVAAAANADAYTDAYANLKTWNDVMGDIPNCMKKTMNIFYKDGVVDKECGAPEKATDDCLCKPKIKEDISYIMTGVSDLDSAFKNACTHSEYTDNSNKLDGLDKRLKGLQSHCLAMSLEDSKDNSDPDNDSDSNSAGSLLPGVSKSMLVIGALVLPAVL